jgi:uncharacterized protein
MCGPFSAPGKGLKVATMMFWLLLVASGFVIGALIGVTGVGAGSLTTPLLITGFGVHPAIAVGTDLFFACVTKLAAGWRHEKLGHVDWAILRPMIIGSSTGAIVTLGVIWWLNIEPNHMAALLRRILAVTLIISASAMILRMILDASRSADERRDVISSTPPRPFSYPLILGVILGVAVTLTSIGAGAIGVVALTALYPAMAAKRIVGTDIVHAIPLTFLAGLGHLTLGHVDTSLLLALLAGSIPGILIGSRMTLRLPDWALRGALVIALLVAARLLWNKF